MSAKPDYLLISRSGLWSGAEKMLMVLVRALAGMEGKPAIRCIFGADVATRLMPADAPNVEVVLKRPLKKVSANPWLIFFYFMCGFLFLFKLVKVPSKCVLVFNDLESLLVCWPGALARRSYFYLHDSHKLEGVKGRGICKLISLLVTRVLVITESRVGKLACIGVTNTRYFPNCVSTKVAPFEQQGTAEKKHGHPAYKAVSVGQITAWKRVDKSIVLVDRLNQLGLPIELEIFGRPDPLSPTDLDYLRKIQEMCSVSGFSSLRGYTEDLSGIYREADLFVSMSVNEPFGLSLVEALSFGVPAIAMEGEGPDEIISDDVGLLLLEGFECDDDLVDRVKHVISISPTKCKERAGLYSYEIYRERVRREFETECSV